MEIDADPPKAIRYIEVTGCVKCGRYHKDLPFIPATDDLGHRVWEGKCPNAFGATPLIVPDNIPDAFAYPSPLNPFESSTISKQELIGVKLA